MQKRGNCTLKVPRLYSIPPAPTLMSFAGYDDPTAWGAPSDAPVGDIVKDAVRKELILKWVLFLVLSTLTLNSFI
jgi:hypothetical protein